MANGAMGGDRQCLPGEQPLPGSGQRQHVEPRTELVLLDVGGPIYDDAVYRDALLRAAREVAAERGYRFSEADFRAVYDEQRQAQRGSLRTAVAERLLTSGDRRVLSDRAHGYWWYPPSALYPDVVPALRAVSSRYRVAVVANQRGVVRDALVRDSVAEYVDIWALSDVVGAEKPDPTIFEYALRAAGVSAEHAVHVGNRLDTDVRGASRLGLRTVWVLRGEAPPNPSDEQLREPDVAVRSLAELPEALDRLAGREIREQQRTRQRWDVRESPERREKRGGRPE